MATHGALVRLAERHLRLNGYATVLTECGAAGARERPDAIGWNTFGESMLIEVKVSRDDFLREWTRVDKKAYRRSGFGVGRRRFYLAPVGMIRADDLRATGWGLLEHTGAGRIRVAALSEEFEHYDLAAEVSLLACALRKHQDHDHERQQQLGLDFGGARHPSKASARHRSAPPGWRDAGRAGEGVEAAVSGGVQDRDGQDLAFTYER